MFEKVYVLQMLAWCERPQMHSLCRIIFKNELCFYLKISLYFVIGAGSGLLLTYATYMSRRNSVVKLGILLPVCNNLIR